MKFMYNQQKNITLALLHIVKDVVVIFREAFHPFVPSIHPVIHPWMASLQPMWLRFCCTLRNSHIIQHYTAVFFFFGKILPTGDKKKPSATSRKELKKRTSRTFAIFLRKKKKRKGRIRQI